MGFDHNVVYKRQGREMYSLGTARGRDTDGIDPFRVSLLVAVTRFALTARNGGMFSLFPSLSPKIVSVFRRFSF